MATPEQALQVLDNFIEECLPACGFYQDALVTGEETMCHSLLSPYLNIGLLHPLEVIQATEAAYLEKNLNLNGVEGFIAKFWAGENTFAVCIFRWMLIILRRIGSTTVSRCRSCFGTPAKQI